MFKSIQWSMQLWHAGLLAVVLVGFGSASYFGISKTRYEQLDAELGSAAQALAAGLHPAPPPGAFPSEKDGSRARRKGEEIEPEGGPPRGKTDRSPGNDDREPSTRPAGGMKEGSSNDRWHGWTLQLDIPAEMAQRFGSDETRADYYVIWDAEGKIIKASGPAADVPYPGSPSVTPFAQPETRLPRMRQRGDRREAYMNGPFWTRILVGRSVRREQAEMRPLAMLLTFIGAGVMIVGLAGGWLLSRRAVQPIRTIAAVAHQISASNLSRRIDVAGTKSELEQLAVILNKTFARLEAAFQQQVRFTADASHELRTPLAIIHTNTQLALSRNRSAEEYRKLFETCLRASTRMKSLVDSLLLLAGADAGRLSLSCARMDLGAIVEESIELVAPLAAEKRVTLETHPRSVEFNGDASRIAQVLTNLVTNAVRYNREGGRVDVSVETDGACAVLTVADTGTGIPAESQPHLFERFYRVDKARSREEGGSGLGLAICKSIIETHGGKISFTSELGKGTTFVVRFPLYDPATHDHDPASSPLHAANSEARTFASPVRG